MMHYKQRSSDFTKNKRLEKYKISECTWRAGGGPKNNNKKVGGRQRSAEGGRGRRSNGTGEREIFHYNKPWSSGHGSFQ